MFTHYVHIVLVEQMKQLEGHASSIKKTVKVDCKLEIVSDTVMES